MFQYLQHDVPSYSNIFSTMSSSILTPAGTATFTYVGGSLHIETKGFGVRHRECIPFDTISSLETISKKHWWLLLMGVVSLLAGLFVWYLAMHGSYVFDPYTLLGKAHFGALGIGVLSLIVFMVVQPRVLIINASGYAHKVRTNSGRGIDGLYDDLATILTERSTPE